MAEFDSLVELGRFDPLDGMSQGPDTPVTYCNQYVSLRYHPWWVARAALI